MNRVEVTNPFVGLTSMQVCAEADATDEEILAVCNSENPSGTMAGWGIVIREQDDYPKQAHMGTCAEYPDRRHYIVLC